MNKNTLWSQPNVARKVAASSVLYGDYALSATHEQRFVTWPLNFTDGITVEWCILDFRLGYATAISGDRSEVLYA